MLSFFHPKINSLKINPEMLKYLNECTKKHVEKMCETQQFAITTSSSSSEDPPDIEKMKVLMFASLASFLAGVFFSRCLF